MAKPAPMSLNSSIARSRLAAAGREVLVRIDQQVAIGAVLVAAHAAAKLVQVGQPVAVRLVDEDRVGVGDVQPALDDRRGQQQVEAVVDEIEHHPLQLVLGHLAVGDAEAGLGHDLPQPRGEDLDVVARGCGRRRSARRGSAPAAPRGGSTRRRTA